MYCVKVESEKTLRGSEREPTGSELITTVDCHSKYSVS